MLRIILRHTHNALLFACILLLLCSFERLCRYDFAQIQISSWSNVIEPAASDTSVVGEQQQEEQEVLQVDHFVFWGGIPAWERTLEARNPVPSLSLFKFMSASPWSTSTSTSSSRSTSTASTSSVAKGTSTSATRSTTAPPSSTTTTTSDEMESSQQHQQQDSTPTSLMDTKRLFQQQIRHHQRLHKNDLSNNNQDKKLLRKQSIPQTTTPRESSVQPQLLQQPQETSVASDTRNPSNNIHNNHDKNDYKIGFILYLPSCDRDMITSWQTVWNDQIITTNHEQFFLIHVLLAATVEPSCLGRLQQDFEDYNNNHNHNNNNFSDNIGSRVVYQVSQQEHVALAFQTCQQKAIKEWMHRHLQLQEALYYDASKAKGRLRSSPRMRRFRFVMPAVASTTVTKSHPNDNPPLPSSPQLPQQQQAPVFQCVGGEQKPAFCDDDGSVMDCPWFQYVSPQLSVQTATSSSTSASSTTRNGQDASEPRLHLTIS